MSLLDDANGDDNDNDGVIPYRPFFLCVPFPLSSSPASSLMYGSTVPSSAPSRLNVTATPYAATKMSYCDAVKNKRMPMARYREALRLKMMQMNVIPNVLDSSEEKDDDDDSVASLGELQRVAETVAGDVTET